MKKYDEKMKIKNVDEEKDSRKYRRKYVDEKMSMILEE